VIVLGFTVALAAVVVDPPPRVGVESTVEVVDADGRPRAGLTLRAVMRPGLPGAREQGAGITDTRGRSRWKPPLAGPALLSAGDEPIGVVRVESAAPPTGVVVSLAVVLAAALGSAVLGRRGPRR
jgi:hypothetical protein